MPVSFLSTEQRENYGRYTGSPSPHDLARYFHLDDADHALIAQKRGKHSRLGFAVQLGTVRYLGTFLEDPLAVPTPVLHTLAKQLRIDGLDGIHDYSASRQRYQHAIEIRVHYGYVEITQRTIGFRLTRWLYALCWTGTDRPSVLFERATAWLVTHKVLLPGATTLERYIARLRARVEERLWRSLGRGIGSEQQARLESLLVVPIGSRNSALDRLRTGPLTISSPALVHALQRLRTVRELGITLPATARIPATRVAALARFAGAAKASAILRLPNPRRLATLVAFVHCLEASAQDDALEVLEALLRDLFGNAVKADRKARLRTLKDLDQAAAVLASACQVVLDDGLADAELRDRLFARIPRAALTQAIENVNALIRPSDNVYYRELDAKYKTVRRFLPALVEHIRFGANAAGEPVVAAFAWLRANLARKKLTEDAPREIVGKAWQRHVVREDGSLDAHAYTFCVLDELQTALRRRDVFVAPSWRYADPRAGLLDGAEWEATRPIICRTLGLSAGPEPTLNALAEELDRTYRTVAARLPDNPAVRFDDAELVLSPLDKLEEPASLVALREKVLALLPRLDLPELILEIAARTRFTAAFTHLSERTARAADLHISVCAVLMAEACNTGLEPLIRGDVPALKRDRLSWVDQNYIRDDTLTAANVMLVAAQSRLALANLWGGGEVASADGMRFVVPVRTVHAGPNPKYFGLGRGVTWYNLLSDQFSGLNDITVPGTLRDSLVLLAVVLEQQTDLQPTQIMTDTGAYSDVVFGLFRLLGYRFSPRLADMGGTRFWRIDPRADYGALNAIATHQLSLQKIAPHWDDMLRLAGSLKLGRVPATGIMRTLQVGDRPTRLAQAIAEFGRIDKTLHTLTYIDDEAKRRGTLSQLNRGEGRHSVARAVFHGKRGELRQHYREGQEDQLGALGLVLNMIVLWNTVYMEAALDRLRQDGYPVQNEDVARLSPLLHEHINMLGRYSFSVPEAVAKGELRPLRDPADEA
ncbi:MULTISPECIES: Tn3 family transposase [Lysobacteraceae]|uniref:Transposase n=1 Tax=Xanthomonas graminis pv. poae TaxID=227946 RepID=A0A199P1X3_9XANT|nr:MULTISPECIES: Tn3 family transposase [Xanthomonadaceae]MBC8772549.1 Tn3 family transposase [Stenotrophomonas maltophilia]OAX54893.1 transposase [Xanthomonas translucens pv. poae]